MLLRISRKMDTAHSFSSRCKKLATASTLQRFEMLREFYWLLKTQYYYRAFFGRIGRQTKIIKPLRLNNVESVHIEDDVIIKQFLWLVAAHPNSNDVPLLHIDKGTRIGHFNHISAFNGIFIGKHVLTADRVFISDNSHSYQDIQEPIMNQEIISTRNVYIGDSSWIGENTCVISCTIGRNSVVGANSVVIHDVPDFSVAVGSPARVVKRYNESSHKWEKTNHMGEFIRQD